MRNSIKTQKPSTFRIFMALLKTDMKLMRAKMVAQTIDALIWAALSLAVVEYVFPALGFKNFGVFQFGSIVITVIGFEIYTQMFVLITNFQYRKDMFHLFTLPIHSGLVFLQKVVFYTINGIIISLVTIPVCKLMLWDKLLFSAINWPLLLITICIASFFFACFLLIIVALAKTLENTEHIFMRIMFPLWFIGGFQFSWQTLFSVNQHFAYLALISPYTYAHEAARAAIINPQQFLNGWMCVDILILLSLVCGFIGYIKIKRNLDLA